jgi:hypothetical protein
MGHIFIDFAISKYKFQDRAAFPAVMRHYPGITLTLARLIDKPNIAKLIQSMTVRALKSSFFVSLFYYLALIYHTLDFVAALLGESFQFVFKRKTGYTHPEIKSDPITAFLTSQADQTTHRYSSFDLSYYKTH